MFYLNEERYRAIEHKQAVIVCNKSVIVDELSYGEVRALSSIVSQWIPKHVQSKCCCIGLQMDHNIYLPVLINSLRHLELPFIFLDKHHNLETAKFNGLLIQWLISFESENYRDKLRLRDDYLFLEEYTLKEAPGRLDNVFYVITTSGTTSAKKVVKVTHECIESNIRALSGVFDISTLDVIFLGTPLTFDPSMIEILLALYNGCCMCIATPETKLNKQYLYEALFLKHSVTMLQIVPSLFLLWSEEQIRYILEKSNLRILAFGGEEFPTQIFRFPKMPKLKIYNLYGITEVSCWATFWEASNTDDGIPIGKSLNHTTVEVRDEEGIKITNGEGEIHIGSDTRICLVDAEVLNQQTVFRATGDIATINSQGIFYLGRKDHTIKRFGHKVHLSQIEREIFKEIALPNKCVWFKEQAKLVAFIKIESEPRYSAQIVDKLRVKLLHSLETQMFPDDFEIVLHFPTTKNGKLDVNFLKSLYLTRISDVAVEPRTFFKSLICKHLGFALESFDAMSKYTFFELGGNSLLAVQILSEFGEHTPSLTTNLLENDLRSCLDCLLDHKFPIKRSLNDKHVSETVVSKRHKAMKYEINFLVEWTYDFKACVDASPIVFTNESSKETFVAVGSFSHTFAILNARTGQEITSFTLPDSIEGKATISPCTNFIYVPCFDGNIYALDYRNNAIAWSYSTDDKVKGAPVLATNNESLIVGSYDKHLHCINIKTGDGIWKCNLMESIVAAPLISKDGNILAVSLNGSCFYLSETDGQIKWIYKTNSPIFGTPCMLKDRFIVACVSGRVLAVSKLGVKEWEFDCSSFVYSSPVCLENCVLVTSHDFNLYIFTVTDDDYSLILQNKIALDDRMSTSPCSGQDKHIFAATNSGNLFALDLRLGSILGEVRLPGEIFSGPCAENGLVYVGCRDNKLYCLGYK